MATHWQYFSPNLGVQSASAGAFPALVYVTGPGEPDAALHPPERPVVLHAPPPVPAALAVSREQHGYMPIELLIAAASLGVVAAWHVRRLEIGRAVLRRAA